MGTHTNVAPRLNQERQSQDMDCMMVQQMAKLGKTSSETKKYSARVVEERRKKIQEQQETTQQQQIECWLEKAVLSEDKKKARCGKKIGRARRKQKQR